MRVKDRAGRHIVRIKIPDQLIMIPVDGTLIEQVLVNLLDNAIKHTPDGTEIRLAVEQNENSIIFEVSDNGPGIPEEDIPLLFNRFFKSNKRDSNSRSGIGLGLTICKSIVEAHEGSIVAMNKPFGGAVFRCTLPALRSNE